MREKGSHTREAHKRDKGRQAGGRGTHHGAVRAEGRLLIPRCEVIRLESKFGPQELLVGLPLGYNADTKQKQDNNNDSSGHQGRFPAIIVPDAEPLFFSVYTQTLRAMKFYDASTPEMVVIGIRPASKEPNEALSEYWEQAKALRRTHFKVDPKKDSPYLDFLRGHVLPEVKKRYHLTTMALVGASLSGLFALKVLFEAPELFDDYIIGSPSIWVASSSIVDVESALSKSGKEPFKTPKHLWFCVGGLEQSMKTDAVRMHEALKSRKYKLLKLEMMVIPGETHHSVKLPMVHHSLQWLCKVHRVRTTCMNVSSS
mmetsp:Transcript_33869/g.65921  ORF Transcript_33869/g.65921 Transcript_33869/m.65921 type:complete len:314 (-) Transcript_33869:30-971(-)